MIWVAHGKFYPTDFDVPKIVYIRCMSNSKKDFFKSTMESSENDTEIP